MDISEKQMWELHAKDPSGFDIPAGDMFFRITASNDGVVELNNTKLTRIVTQDHQYVLRPNETIIVASRDSYSIPGMLEVRVGGSHFAFLCGLHVECWPPEIPNSHRGQIQFRVHNISENKVKICVGSPIGRFFFDGVRMD